MIASALSAGFEWLYGLRLFAALGALWAFRRSYRPLDWRFSWPGVAGGALIFAVWIGIDRWTGAAAASMPQALASAGAGARTAWIVLRVLGGSLTVPIAEELAFRGFLMRRFMDPDFEKIPFSYVRLWPALLVSSVLFGMMHGSRWPAGILAGLVFGWVAIRRDRIGEAVAAHAAANLLIAVYVLTQSAWQLW